MSKRQERYEAAWWTGAVDDDRDSINVSEAARAAMAVADEESSRQEAHQDDTDDSVGSFSRALDVLKAGGSVSRSVWGKGTYVVLQKGYPDGIAINGNTAEATGLPEGTLCRFQPYLMIRAADGSFVPWVASTDNILAEDWQEGPNEPEQHPQADLEELRRDRAKLYALQAAGVDNWSGYQYAMEIYREDAGDE